MKKIWHLNWDENEYVLEQNGETFDELLKEFFEDLGCTLYRFEPRNRYYLCTVARDDCEGLEKICVEMW